MSALAPSFNHKIDPIELELTVFNIAITIAFIVGYVPDRQGHVTRKGLLADG